MKGHFKTALGQVTVIVDCTVSENLVVGQLVKLASGALTGDKIDISTATHIVALSDMTLEGPVNLKNTRADEIYSNVVAKSDTVKKVGLYKITDKDDIITE
jgi:hypothetical protein